jgi:hypothetical protein
MHEKFIPPTLYVYGSCVLQRELQEWKYFVCKRGKSGSMWQACLDVTGSGSADMATAHGAQITRRSHEERNSQGEVLWLHTVTLNCGDNPGKAHTHLLLLVSQQTDKLFALRCAGLSIDWTFPLM